MRLTAHPSVVLNMQFTEAALNQALELVDRAIEAEGARAPFLALKGNSFSLR